MTLTEFLTARLEEEADGSLDWHERGCQTLKDASGHPGYPALFDRLSCNCGVPQRVLREIAAKRAILAAWQDAVRQAGTYDEEPEWLITRRTALEHACALLSQIYNNQPQP